LRHRSQEQIIYDMLKVLSSHDMPIPNRLLYKEALLSSWDIELRYLTIITEFDFAISTGVRDNDITHITNRGRQFMLAWEDVEHLMRSGFKP